MKTLKTSLALIFAITICISCKKEKKEQNVDVTTGLHIKDGKYLSDKCGNKIVLRGVNIGNVFAVNLGAQELEEIEKTGANSVRLVFNTSFNDYRNGRGGALTALTAADIEPLIQSCIAKGMIPVLSLHDYTGQKDAIANLPKVSAWWTQSSMKTMLLKYQKSIILNYANEPSAFDTNPNDYYTANNKAIKDLRDAGYSCPLMVDANENGKDITFFVNRAKALMDADPLHSLIFSVHTYWPTIGLYGNYSDIDITSKMLALKNLNLPITIGELAKADVHGADVKAINYKLLMKLCKDNEFGYLAWWWGFINNPGSNNQLSMTPDGLYNGLAGAGKEIAVTDVNSIKNTAKRVCN